MIVMILSSFLALSYLHSPKSALLPGESLKEDTRHLPCSVAMFAKLAMAWYLSPLATVISPLVLQLPSIGSFAVHLC